MVFYQFQQVENEEYQRKKKWNSAVGIVAAGSNGTVMNSVEANFHYVGIFAMIAKLRYVAKILFVAKFFAFAVLCINDFVLVFLISTLVIAFVWFVFVISLGLSTI